jgi:hypothetical protein
MKLSTGYQQVIRLLYRKVINRFWGFQKADKFDFFVTIQNHSHNQLTSYNSLLCKPFAKSLNCLRNSLDGRFGLPVDKSLLGRFILSVKCYVLLCIVLVTNSQGYFGFIL